MSYRPITDMWLLAHSRVKYYGAYPFGFLDRARALLGVTISDPVLHVCSGAVRKYPYRGLGPNDKTLDLNPDTEPDYIQDARDPLPEGFCAVLADPDYSDKDADQRPMGRASRPTPTQILQAGFAALPVGGRVGLLHYFAPKAPKGGRVVALVGVVIGFNARIRVFSVYEKGAA